MTQVAQVIQAEIGDIKPIRPLIFGAAVDLYTGATTDQHLVAWLGAFASVQSLEDRLHSPGSYLVVALDTHGRIIGTGHIGDMGYVGGIAVATPGRGDGSAILDHLLDRAMTRPWMSVWTGDAAMLALACSRGFTSVTIDPDERYLPDLQFQILHQTDQPGVAAALRPRPTLLAERAA